MGRKEDNLEDFALGGRRIPWWAVLASLVAAETSAGTFFGTPGEGYSHRDYTYLQLAFGARLYVAAIALALAYEMISGARPNQTQTLWIYIGATIAIVILTAIYTTFGGIKAVIWTDLIQASIMIGSALIALGLLYSAIPGGWNEIVERHGAFQVSDLFATGLDPARHGWDKWKGMFETEYTVFAILGAVFITMGTHGT